MFNNKDLNQVSGLLFKQESCCEGSKVIPVAEEHIYHHGHPPPLLVAYPNQSRRLGLI
jgi:hypothetical protein